VSNAIQVKCGQCQHFTPHNENSVFGDNGFCSKWEQKLNTSTRTESIEFYSELGGIEFHDDLLRECGSFAGKYSFVGGEQ